MTPGAWSFTYRVDGGLPPLSWLARIERGSGNIEVTCGSSVRLEGSGFFEGTWAGDPDLASISGCTTVFGSGIVADEDCPVVVTPAHAISGVFTHRSAGETVISNTLVGLLVALDAQLVPTADYPGRFVRSIDGVANSPIELPTNKGAVAYHFYWNLRVGADGTITQVAKPTEEPFRSFADYRSRISAALRTSLANAGSYQPAVSLSSGYDSTAVAALAAEHGCRRALTLVEGRRSRRAAGAAADSGDATAKRLGMEVATFDRRAYLSRTDLPEAEFLATGMSGEDVVMSPYEPRLYRSILLTGTQGNGIWRVGGSHRADLRRSALDGGSLNEFRLRTDFHFVPLPVFGLAQRASVMLISASPEMKAWSVGGRYDQPISRRIAEEAGLARGSFAVTKQAASALIHSAGESELAPATLAALRVFAEAEGRSAAFGNRKGVRRWHRLVLRVAPRWRGERLVAGLRKRQRLLVHFEPVIGTLLLRWAVGVIRPRYGAFASRGSAPSPTRAE